MKRTLTLLSLLGLWLRVAAQGGAPMWLEQTLYGNGKINVVVAVVAVIIAGIGLWMWRMDRRLTKLERTNTRSKQL
jgi:CcmD family protein